MKKNSGVTLINMMIIILIIIILSSVSIIGGREILEDAKNSQKEENLMAVKTAVNNVSLKLGTAGTLAPANVKLYGKIAANVLSGDANELKDWYVLDEEELEEMGIEYLDEVYIVNYKENKVLAMSDYAELQ